MNFLKEGKTNWKYILIVVILAIIVSGGMFGYYRWMAKREKAKMPEEKAPEKVSRYPRSVELFQSCFTGYYEFPEEFTEKDIEEIIQKTNASEEEAKKYLEEFSTLISALSVVSEEEVVKVFEDMKEEEVFGKKIATLDDLEETLKRGFIEEKEEGLLYGIHGWGGIRFLCQKNLNEENLRPQIYNKACQEKPACCDLPEPKDTDSINELAKRLSECIEPNFGIEEIKKLKYGYLIKDGWAHIEAVPFSYYLTDTGCLVNCYFPYLSIAAIKQPLFEKKLSEFYFEKLPEEIKTKVREFEDKIETLYQKAISEKNTEICEEIKKEVEKVEAVSEKDSSSWEFEAMTRKSAYGYEDEYYQPCIMIIAVKLNDESLCDKMPSPKVCREELFLQYTDLCEEMPVDIIAKEGYCRWPFEHAEENELCMEALAKIRAKENCIKKIALDTENIELCKKILDADCQNELAIKLNKPGECVWNSCFEELAIRNNDVELCKKITNIGKCVGEIAINTNNVNLCGEISEKLEREKCYILFGKKIGENEDVKLCEKLPTIAYQTCKKEVAIRTGNVGLCGEDKNCIKAVAVSTNNPDICKILPSGYWRDECYKELGIKLPYLGVPYLLIDKEVQRQFNLPVDYGALIPEIPEGYGGTVITPGSPADKAGIKEKDIILEVNGERITKENDLQDVIRRYKIGDEIILKILRQGKEIAIKVILEEKP